MKTVQLERTYTGRRRGPESMVEGKVTRQFDMWKAMQNIYIFKNYEEREGEQDHRGCPSIRSLMYAKENQKVLFLLYFSPGFPSSSFIGQFQWLALSFYCNNQRNVVNKQTIHNFICFHHDPSQSSPLREEESQSVWKPLHISHLPNFPLFVFWIPFQSGLPSRGKDQQTGLYSVF